MSTSRESQIIDAFRAVAPAPASDDDDHDVLDALAGRCAALAAADAGVVLADGDGRLSVPAASSPRCRLFTEFSVAIDSGPSVECARGGEPVASADLTSPTARTRWPRYTDGADEASFRAAHALPLRAGEAVLGSVTLLDIEPHPLADPDAELAQALAETAAAAVAGARARRRAETTAGQLQTALDSRVVIEQAKGILAAQARIEPGEAFTVLRGHARGHGLRLREVARSVVEGTLDWAGAAGGAARVPQRRRPGEKVAAAH